MLFITHPEGYWMEAKSKEGAIENARQFRKIHRIHWPQFEGFCEVLPLEVD
jgi:hypothetical protein